MKLTKCMHGHYYDGSKNSACPQCIEKGYITSSGYSGTNGKASKEKSEINSSGVNSNFEYVNVTDAQSVHSIHPEVAPVPSKENFDTKTTDFIGGFWGVAEADDKVSTENDDSVQKAVLQENGKESVDLSENTHNNSAPESEIHSPQSNDVHRAELEPVSPQEPVQQTPSSPLRNEIARASASNANPFEDTKTVAFYNGLPSEPVVGWLIALNGAYMGKSFPLKSGYNTIGRWPKMDIALTQEPTVSRDRHSIVTYEPKNRVFFIQPGESNGLTYVNDEVLLSPSSLSDESIIQLGECKLLFKALCGKNFSWDNLI